LKKINSFNKFKSQSAIGASVELDSRRRAFFENSVVERRRDESFVRLVEEAAF
jgi:hypothetical protein